jgi:hypothetical protein
MQCVKIDVLLDKGFQNFIDHGRDLVCWLFELFFVVALLRETETDRNAHRKVGEVDGKLDI